VTSSRANASLTSGPGAGDGSGDDVRVGVDDGTAAGSSAQPAGDASTSATAIRTAPRRAREEARRTGTVATVPGHTGQPDHDRDICGARDLGPAGAGNAR